MSMNNMGKTIPHERVTAAEAALREMLPGDSSADRLNVLQGFVERLEADQPAVLLCADPPAPYNLLDLTGRYRLVAHLLGN